MKAASSFSLIGPCSQVTTNHSRQVELQNSFTLNIKASGTLINTSVPSSHLFHNQWTEDWELIHAVYSEFISSLSVKCFINKEELNCSEFNLMQLPVSRSHHYHQRKSYLCQPAHSQQNEDMSYGGGRAFWQEKSEVNKNSLKEQETNEDQQRTTHEG